MPVFPATRPRGGLARLPALLEAHSPSIVILELGGNDGLRGQPLTSLRGNLLRMIELVLASGATPVLAGMQIPPNYGPAYAGGVCPDVSRSGRTVRHSSSGIPAGGRRP